jgi:hypothetical protein
MSNSLDTPAPGAMPPALTLTTPTGLQSIDELTRRRRIVFALNAVTYAAMLWVAALVLGSGWTWVDMIRGLPSRWARPGRSSASER